MGKIKHKILFHNQKKKILVKIHLQKKSWSFRKARVKLWPGAGVHEAQESTSPGAVRNSGHEEEACFLQSSYSLATSLKAENVP